MIVIIDNYDSFTYNLVQYLGELGADIQIFRNDALTIEDIHRLATRRKLGEARAIADGKAIDIQLRHAVPSDPAHRLAECGIGLAVDSHPIVDDRVHGECKAQVGAAVVCLARLSVEPY